ncbi:MAG: glycosyltransferase [Moorea sp. SIO3I7]|nr:glycosyltransferase [Moorena sp. SIO3I7]NEO05007.1 glycosyltransferase [Moorena sp. SIO3I8]NEO64793.1 glycosyltransferase [Moorena sp. SIO4G2]NEP21336.1 glycosyltransferase [Moorena sp. SIO3I6]NEQ56888.1 glycosyltransferase [Moorena sp. SIO4A1]
MKIMHNGLQDLLLINFYSQEIKLDFLSIEIPIPDSIKNFTNLFPYRIGLHLRREYRHIAMGIRSLTSEERQDYDGLFLFEIYLQNIYLLLPLLAWHRKPVWICLHWNQQLAMHSTLKFLGLMYLKFFLKYFNLKAVLFEMDDEVLPKRFRLPASAKVKIPMPIRSDAYPNLKPGERLPTDKKIKIGVVGMIRKDKPIAKIIEILKDYTKLSDHKSELVLGVPFWQKPKDLDNLGVKMYDTTTEKQYLDLLNEVDILVAHYEKHRYYYRTSGVLSDAACCGCYVITSDYPVLRHQVNWPVSVGSTFKTFDEIPSLLDEAIYYIREHGQDNQWLWREKRTAEEIATVFSKGIRE